MRIPGLVLSWMAAASLVAGDAVNDLEKKGRVQIDEYMAKSKTCTKENLRVRREW
jgi:tyrosinase